ncbi:hypothetical protein EN916_20395, partial [Mesorhizobium sp. M7A.F.Ca.CA.001.11.2.1]
MQTRKSSRPAPKDRPPLRRASLDTSPPIDGVEESARLSEPTPVLLGRVSPRPRLPSSPSGGGRGGSAKPRRSGGT